MELSIALPLTFRIRTSTESFTNECCLRGLISSNSRDESELDDIYYAIIKREKWNSANSAYKKNKNRVTSRKIRIPRSISINFPTYRFQQLRNINRTKAESIPRSKSTKLCISLDAQRAFHGRFTQLFCNIILLRDKVKK